MNRRLVVIAVLVALAVLLLDNWLSNRREQKQQAAASAAHVADYFMRDFTATTMDPQGKPVQRLAAQLMEHYADDNTMELTAPRLTLYQKAGPPWQINAAHGSITDDGKQVRLSGGVRMTQDDNGRTLALVTDHLLLRPKRHYAETDAAVTITAPQGVVSALGMRANLAEQRLSLLANVRGNYVP